MKSDFSSCLPTKPLVALEGDESARASVLNYNLPSSTTFRVKNYITIRVPDDYWNAAALKAEKPPHEALKEPPETTRADPPSAPPARLIGDYLKDILKNPPTAHRPVQIGPHPVDDPVDPFVGNLNPVITELAATHQVLAPLLLLNQPEQFFQPATFEKETTVQSFTAAETTFDITPRVARRTLSGASAAPVSQAASLKQAEAFLGTTVAEVNLRAAYGELPVFRRTLYGNFRTDFVKDPGTTARPTLVLIEEYEIASYLGDYGAGKTIKTFSLLPGEKTTISLKTYRTTTENKAQTENILDSFSQNSADTLESMVNDELATSESTSDAVSTGFSSTENWSQQAGMSASGGGSIGLFKAKASVSASASRSDTDVNTSTSNSSRANTTNGLKKSMDRHVSQSEAARKVEVNTETQQSSSTTTGEEASTVREIQNINHSRVLNFVFRQLCQEYVTVTYLNDVSFGFTKGNPGDGRTAKLDNFEGLLRSVIKEEHVSEVLSTIIDELANVADYNGVLTQFVERKDETIKSLVDPNKAAQTRHYFRKNVTALDQSWDESGKTVNGVILDVSRRILTTDAVIVEALLGQGEALDCYNQRLQDAAATRADLENAAKKQALGIIDAIDDPIEKVNLYKKVFGTDPQTIVKGID